MKKFLTTLVAGLLSVQPSLATPTDQLVEDHAFLLGVVEQLGVKVVFNGTDCRTKPGLYGNYYLDGSLMNLCSVGDKNERLDTMRHEAWHTLQDLRDCNLRDTGRFTTVFGGRGPTNQFVALATKHYDKEYVPTESEAFWAAHTFDSLAIANMLIQKGEECGFKFKGL